MANKSVFASLAGRLLPKATATNAAGAKAYAYGAEHKLAQLAMTGSFGGGFYQDAQAEVSGFFFRGTKQLPVLWDVVPAES